MLKNSIYKATPPKFPIDKLTGEPKLFSNSTIKVNGNPLKVKLTGRMFMIPTRSEHDDFGLSYKIGCEFDTLSAGIKSLDAALLAIGSNLLDGESQAKEPHNDGTMFLKLPVNSTHTEFKMESNIPIKPTKLLNDKIDQDMDVTVELLVSGWYRNDPEEDGMKYGLSFKMKKIHFGEEKKTKKQKVDLDDEVTCSF